MSSRIKKIYLDRQGVDQQTIRDRTVQYSTGLNSNYDRPTARIGRRIGSDIRISLPGGKEDPHHCTCFRVEEDLVSCKAKLEKIGCKPQILEENHGQVFGLTFRINEYEQIHIKSMPDGIIEAEIEPPPDYPGAHLNPEHSYSAHNELGIVLSQAGIQYGRRVKTPLTCIQRVIKKPVKPTHVVTIVVGVVLVIAFVGIFAGLAKGGARL
jgi:hypothetical protein